MLPRLALALRRGGPAPSVPTPDDMLGFEGGIPASAIAYPLAEGLRGLIPATTQPPRAPGTPCSLRT